MIIQSSSNKGQFCTCCTLVQLCICLSVYIFTENLISPICNEPTLHANLSYFFFFVFFNRIVFEPISGHSTTRGRQDAPERSLIGSTLTLYYISGRSNIHFYFYFYFSSLLSLSCHVICQKNGGRTYVHTGINYYSYTGLA